MAMTSAMFSRGVRASAVSRAFSRRFSKGQIEVSNEVRSALSNGQPVVALESTIITHGMPQPHNLNTALAVEDIIRKEGAVPATIAILEGRVHAGLTKEQLQVLADLTKSSVKTSRRDFPYVMAKGLNGGTTVSGTILVSDHLGVPLFVTGGVGGVHRGAELSWDVSADLTELGRSRVSVVSAGVKSILDVGMTLEYLETQGVCVATVGQSKSFPDFFTRDSGFESPCHLATTCEAGQMVHSWWQSGVCSGMLLACPVPAEYEADGAAVKNAIEQAVAEAKGRVTGRYVTPFVLQRVNQLTQGRSLQSNIALIRNNAKLGAEIAVHHATLRNGSSFIPATKTQDEEISSFKSPVG